MLSYNWLILHSYNWLILREGSKGVITHPMGVVTHLMGGILKFKICLFWTSEMMFCLDLSGWTRRGGRARQWICFWYIISLKLFGLAQRPAFTFCSCIEFYVLNADTFMNICFQARHSVLLQNWCVCVRREGCGHIYRSRLRVGSTKNSRYCMLDLAWCHKYSLILCI